MIQFTYRLKGAGWAVAAIGDGQTEVTFPASYLCDALRDFVDAVQSLFTTGSAECIWEEEPGLVCWRFNRTGDTVAVEVRWLKEERPMSFGKDDLLHFASTVDRELRNLLDEWGADRYLKEWQYPFPIEEQQRLEQAIERERERRKLEKQEN